MLHINNQCLGTGCSHHWLLFIWWLLRRSTPALLISWSSCQLFVYLSGETSMKAELLKSIQSQSAWNFWRMDIKCPPSFKVLIHQTATNQFMLPDCCLMQMPVKHSGNVSLCVLLLHFSKSALCQCCQHQSAICLNTPFMSTWHTKLIISG